MSLTKTALYNKTKFQDRPAKITTKMILLLDDTPTNDHTHTHTKYIIQHSTSLHFHARFPTLSLFSPDITVMVNWKLKPSSLSFSVLFDVLSVAVFVIRDRFVNNNNKKEKKRKKSSRLVLKSLSLCNKILSYLSRPEITVMADWKLKKTLSLLLSLSS